MGNRIKELRKKLNLSQTQLAKKMNTTQANISSWEKNKWQPDNEALIKLSNIFECSIDYLLCKSNDLITEKKLQPISVEVKEELTDKQKELLSLIKKDCYNLLVSLTDDQAKLVYAYMLGLTNQQFKNI